jgi:1-deoxy-D-xylulose-5-phosphate synthase
LDHASRSEVLESVGLTEQHIARQVTGWVAALGALDDSVTDSADKT